MRLANGIADGDLGKVDARRREPVSHGTI